MTWQRSTRNRQARGYGRAHDLERARRLRHTRATDPCGNCGRPLGPDTTRWHLPHTPDRTGYLPGMWCAPCNVKDGARRGARRRHAQTTVRRRHLLG